jgi:transposase InsO family protein
VITLSETRFITRISSELVPYFYVHHHLTSRFAWVYLLKNKSDAAKAIKDFVRKAERQHKTKILRFRTDNGGEYVNKEIETFFSESGISHNRTVPYSHESNGVAERFNRTIITIARTLLVDYESKALWAEAIAYAVYTKNRLLHNALLLYP